MSCVDVAADSHSQGQGRVSATRQSPSCNLRRCVASTDIRFSSGATVAQLRECVYACLCMHGSQHVCTLARVCICVYMELQ